MYHRWCHLNDPVNCNICNKTLQNKLYLQLHKRTHDDDKNYSCTFCGKIFSCQNKFSKHRRLHSSIFSCDYCDKTFARNDYLTKHKVACAMKQLKKDDIQKVVTCNVCNEIFENNASLRKHIVIHKPLPKCDMCEKTFKTKKILKEHKLLHLPMSSELSINTVQCNTCKKTFSSKKSIAVSDRLLERQIKKT